MLAAGGQGFCCASASKPAAAGQAMIAHIQPLVSQVKLSGCSRQRSFAPSLSGSRKRELEKRAFAKPSHIFSNLIHHV
jgi:hypothetical protein